MKFILCLFISFIIFLGQSPSYASSTQQNFTCADFMGSFPLTYIDDYHANGTVRETLNNTCGAIWSIEISLSGSLTVSLKNRMSPDSQAIGLADPVLSVYDETGVQLAYNDDSGGTLNSFLTTNTLSAGSYFIVVAGINGTTGSYELSVSASLEPPPQPVQAVEILPIVIPQQQQPAQPMVCDFGNATYQTYVDLVSVDDLTLNASVTGVSVSQCGDAWSIQIFRPYRLIVGVVGYSTIDWGALPDPYLVMLDDWLNVIDEDDNSGGELSPYIETGLLDAGIYHFIVRDVNGNNGSYELFMTLMRDPDPIAEPPAQNNQPPVQNNQPPAQNNQPPAQTAKGNIYFDNVSYTIQPDDRECIIVFTLKNEGDASVNNFVVNANPPRNWTDAQKTISLGAGRSSSYTMTLTFPDNLWGRTADIELTITSTRNTESNTNDNTFNLTVDIPARPQATSSSNNNTSTTTTNTRQTQPRTTADTTTITAENEGDMTPYIVGGIVAIVAGGGVIWVWRHRVGGVGIDANTRRYWQDHATTERPLDPCKPNTSWCQMTKVEPQYHRYEFEKVEILALATIKDPPRDVHELSHDIIKRLNSELIFTRTALEWDKLYWRMTEVSRMILHEVANWLMYQRGVHYIGFNGYIEGSDVEFEFTLYHCDITHWLHEASWTASLSDKRKMPIITIPNTIGTPDYEHLVVQLAGGLVELYRKI